MRFGEYVENVVQTVGDFIVPRECLVCGRILMRGEECLCIYCESDLPLTFQWTMAVNPMADKYNGLIQKHIDYYNSGRRVRYAYASALFYYRSSSGYRKIPQYVKYKGNRNIGRRYGAILGHFLSSSPHFSSVDLVIPVPLHWTRYWNRGYNQAAVIAQGVAESLGVELRTDIISRNRRTISQTRLSKDEKLLNVENAFAASQAILAEGRAVYGQKKTPLHILLVDDVFTTGATAAACHAALYNSLPKGSRISVATLGFVDND